MKQKKRIMLKRSVSILLLVLGVFSFYFVSNKKVSIMNKKALVLEDNKKTNETCLKREDHCIKDKYGIDMSIEDDNLIITMNFKEKVNPKFQIVEIFLKKDNVVDISNKNLILMKNQSVKINLQELRLTDLNIIDGLTIGLKSQNDDLDDINLDYHIVWQYSGNPVNNQTVKITTEQSDKLTELTNKINNSNNNSRKLCSGEEKDWNSFEKVYCKGQTEVSAKVHVNEEDYSNKDFPSKVSLKCDSTDISNVSPTSKNYYTNKSILKYKKTETLELDNYEYNYAPGDRKTVPISCDVTCEETVTVEYGPPIAVRAGLCTDDYEVKVTSYVICTGGNPNPPDLNKTICTPSPICYHGTWNEPQAGPSEEFDSCILKCDGGKYTTSCSKKCYKEVYNTSLGSNISSKTSFWEGIDDAKRSGQEVKVEGIEYCLTNSLTDPYNFNGSTFNANYKGKDFYGCYYWDKNEISFVGAKRDSNGNVVQDFATPGKWYYLSRLPWKESYGNYQYHVPYPGGFMRMEKDRQVCMSTCKWEGCNKGQYLNPGDKTADITNNLAKYEAAINACKAKASCQEKETTYTVTINQNGKEVTEKDIENNIKEDNTTSPATLGTTDKLNGKNYLMDYDGCYYNEPKDNAWYHAKWGFGSSWINNKSGAISYSEPKDQTGWTSLNNTFCFSYNLANVNEKWFNYYYTKIVKDKSYSIDDEKIFPDNSCNYKVENLDQDDLNKIVYNIVSSTRNFGHFGWNIDIGCFYAYNNNICGESDQKLRVRSVDLVDMFPSESGDSHSTELTGRNPGFNWSEYASNVIKDKDYSSEPNNYIKWVQYTGYNVYNDEFLDYQIHLTPTDLRNIKNNNKKYTDFEGKTNNYNSYFGYKSSLLDKIAVVRPNENSIKCNNMKNHEDGCENFNDISSDVSSSGSQSTSSIGGE